ncbi:hypothetical protein PF046_19075 [Bacillus amyloliquefaciens]|uniref:hypothetical protein n=1 Tax=Bacillus amyloliquefaciens group TaxID=1938374 RepID=UPI002E1D6A43|nr:hypothetical protein [Bacillus velezensis]
MTQLFNLIDQLALGISLLGISLILGWLCEYDIKKKIYEKEEIQEVIASQG